jgi:hypothetical protein
VLYGDGVVALLLRSVRTSVWLRWGGGVAMAVSLVVVVLMVCQLVGEGLSAVAQVVVIIVFAIQFSVNGLFEVSSSVDAGVVV